jgi:hypothetical protein
MTSSSHTAKRSAGTVAVWERLHGAAAFPNLATLDDQARDRAGGAARRYETAEGRASEFWESHLLASRYPAWRKES